MTTINVCNRNILLAHGDFINGGGSGTSINRGVSNMRNVLSFRKGIKRRNYITYRITVLMKVYLIDYDSALTRALP